MAAPRVNCPTCQREVEWSEQFPFRPFCSERCRMVDLGAWFAEERRLPGDEVDELENPKA
ncbi:MAG TPA: DNA gyrase inhibitor YacG [Steroidobacteraceae bacterium]|nr:DNA gyrase inhibitor YacG [Steroidobacteraceae bacterium]